LDEEINQLYDSSDIGWNYNNKKQNKRSNTITNPAGYTNLAKIVPKK